jgi:hypothetical protein
METTTSEPVRTFDATTAPSSMSPMEWAAECLNCRAALAGTFCSSCGQRAVPPDPTLRELAGDAFVEFSGWDGKFAETIRALLFKPGFLTREFIAGRRVSYISPVRLYLTLSFVYFVVAASAPNLRATDGLSAGGIAITTTSTSTNGKPHAADRVASAASAAQKGTLTPAERDSALAQVRFAPRILRPLLRRSIGDPEGFRRGILGYLPKVLFVLLPVFAAIVALFYRRRKYPEHLYFALHVHSFLFLALTLSAAAKFTHVVPLAVCISVLAGAWVVGYSFVAVRRVYGGSRLATVVKAAGIGALYAMAGAVAMLGMVFWAALAE